MLSKSRISHIRSLHQKKFREESRTFIAEGSKLVNEFLGSDFRVQAVYATDDWLKRHGDRSSAAEETNGVTAEELSRITALSTASDVLAVIHMPDHRPDLAAISKTYSILLDGIRDPGNLGTILRIADWFGIAHVICSPDSAEVWNPKTVQASMGSVIRVNTYEMEPASFLRSLPGNIPVYGTYLDGNSIYEEQFGDKGVLVIGNEASGIRPETAERVTKKITIPSFAPAGKGAESLNAAIAAAICCSEIRRKS